MPEIRHEHEAHRFALELDGASAFVTYRERARRVLDLDHTLVPPAARGRGIASELTAHALQHARQHGYTVVPSGPFVAASIKRHPDYRDLLA